MDRYFSADAAMDAAGALLVEFAVNFRNPVPALVHHRCSRHAAKGAMALRPRNVMKVVLFAEAAEAARNWTYYNSKARKHPSSSSRWCC